MMDFILLLKFLLLISGLIGLFIGYKFFQFRKLYHQCLSIENRDDYSSLGRKHLQFYLIDTSKHNKSEYYLKKAKRYKLISILLFIWVLFLFIVITAFHKGVDISEKPDQLDALIKGKFAYDIPCIMNLGDSYSGTATITKSLNDSILFIGLDSTEFIKEAINVSSRVKVNLIDPDVDNFKITSLSSEEQLVDDSSNTIWKWNIIPNQAGNNKLIIRATLKIRNNLGDNYKDIPVFERIIKVKATVYQTVWQFISKYWIFLMAVLTIILIPVGKCLFSKIRNSRRKDKNKTITPIGFKKSGK